MATEHAAERDDTETPDLRVFMSYRRSDDANFTGRFHDKLVSTFGEPNIFRDIDSLAAGTPFAAVINDRLSTVDAVVALIGPTWAPRLESPTDFVRMEIAHALRERKPVIPVLIEDTPLPSAADLPDDLRALLDINAVRVRRDPDFHRDAARVIAGIRENVRVLREEARRRQEESERLAREREEAARRIAEARRRELEDELARAEAQEAERRQAAEALERERATRLAEMARLEEELTRRQLADEQARLAEIEEARERREEERARAEARARELRAQLERVGSTSPSILPPPVPPPPPPPPRLSDRPRPAAESAHGGLLDSRRHIVGAACVVVAGTLGIVALGTNGSETGGALNHGTPSDLVQILLTLALFAPVLARRASDASAIAFGVLVGFLGREGLTNIYWFWDGDFDSFDAYPRMLLYISVFMIAAIVLLHGEAASRVRSRRRARLGQLAAALVALVCLVTFIDRMWRYITDDGSAPRLIVPFGLPALVLVVLALSRRRFAAMATVALAAMSIVANLADALVTEWGHAHVARAELVVAALAAGAMIAIVRWRLQDEAQPHATLT